MKRNAGSSQGVGTAAGPSFEDAYSILRRVVRVRAANVTKTYGLPRCERNDLEQEALLDLWRKRDAYDPKRGCWRTFSETVVANKMASLVRSMCSHRSAFFKEQPIERASSLAAPDRRDDMRADVRRVLADVSEFDRRIARSLTYRSAAETSRSMGFSRAKVYRAIGRLRVAFSAAGFAPRRGRPASACGPNCDSRIEVRRQEALA